MGRERLAHIALRGGAAFAFLYPAIRAIYDPTTWLAYFPPAVLDLPGQLGIPIEPLVLLHGFGVLEVILALWILWGKSIRIPAVLATIILLAIVAFDWTEIDVTFRDLSIAAMTLALALWPKTARP